MLRVTRYAKGEKSVNTAENMELPLKSDLPELKIPDRDIYESLPLRSSATLQRGISFKEGKE